MRGITSAAVYPVLLPPTQAVETYTLDTGGKAAALSTALKPEGHQRPRGATNVDKLGNTSPMEHSNGIPSPLGNLYVVSKWMTHGLLGGASESNHSSSISGR